MFYNKQREIKKGKFMDNVSFGNQASYNSLVNKVYNVKPSRFYADVKHSLNDSAFILTEDEFKKAIPETKKAAEKYLKEAEEIFGKGNIAGDSIKDAMILIKNKFGFKTDY